MKNNSEKRKQKMHTEVGEPDALANLVAIFAQNSQPLADFIEKVADRFLQSKQAQIQFSIRLAWIVVSLVVVIVAVSAFLTYYGKIDGSTFTFLLGLLVGYVLTFVRDAVKPNNEQ